MEEEAVLLAMLLDEDQDQSRSRIWVHPINLCRETRGEFHVLFPDLRADTNRFLDYFRMSVECFDELLEIIKEDITKQFTSFRRPIEPAERLAVTLRYLATGDFFKTIGNSYRMGSTTVSAIVLEVCNAIWNRMQPLFMPQPTPEMWEQNIKGFNEKWQFPNCLGSIDVKHLTIKCPNDSGSNYSHLQKLSIVLMTIVDHDYKFIAIDVGGYGNNSDRGIFEHSVMGEKFNSGIFQLPNDRPLPYQIAATPCVIIGDEAFPLKEFLMRPYPHRQSRSDRRKDNFNKRLCRAHGVVKNAFGIASLKFPLIQRPIKLKIESTIIVIKAVCVLHNFLRERTSDELTVEEDVSFIQPFQNFEIDGRRPTNQAFQIRERFQSYFNNG